MEPSFKAWSLKDVEMIFGREWKGKGKIRNQKFIAGIGSSLDVLDVVAAVDGVVVAD